MLLFGFILYSSSSIVLLFGFILYSSSSIVLLFGFVLYSSSSGLVFGFILAAFDRIYPPFPTLCKDPESLKQYKVTPHYFSG